MSTSAEFTCPCGKGTSWITEGEDHQRPCPHCGRRFRGQYNPDTLTVDAIVTSEPALACAASTGMKTLRYQYLQRALVRYEGVIQVPDAVLGKGDDILLGYIQENEHTAIGSEYRVDECQDTVLGSLKVEEVDQPANPETTHVEVITEGSPEHVIRSDIVVVPWAELAAAIEQYKITGTCSCGTRRRFIYDIEGEPYSPRFCSVCKRSLGFI